MPRNREMIEWCAKIEGISNAELREHFARFGAVGAGLSDEQRTILTLKMRATDERGRVDPLLWLAYTHYRRKACYGACPKCVAGMVPDRYSSLVVCPLCTGETRAAVAWGGAVVMEGITPQEAERWLRGLEVSQRALFVGVKFGGLPSARRDVYAPTSDPRALREAIAGLDLAVVVTTGAMVDHVAPHVIPALRNDPRTILVLTR